MNTRKAARTLITIKMVHTAIWAFFVGCILAIWVFAWQARYGYASMTIGVVLIEVIVLGLNGLRCPLTSVAGRYTGDRSDNFDIYIPAWIARRNKLIFGSLYAGGMAFTFARWTFGPA